jgi:hypothetical protein
MYHNTQVSYKQMLFKNGYHSYVRQYHTSMKEFIHLSSNQRDVENMNA